MVKGKVFGHAWHLMVIAFVLVFAASRGSSLAEEPWISTWPGGQPNDEIVVLVVAPSDARVVYAATKAALYRSGDAGQSWSADGSLANIAALAVDPRNGDVVLAYVWPEQSDAPQELKGLRKSVDAGRTWSDPSNGFLADRYGPISTLAIDLTNPDIIFAGTGYLGRLGRILRSTNGGAIWEEAFSFETTMGHGYVSALAVHQAASSVVYAGIEVYHGGYVTRSDDGGVSWRYLASVDPLSFPSALALDPNDPNVVYAAYQGPTGGGIRVYRSDNGGVSWSRVGEGLSTEGTSLAQLMIDPLDPWVLYLSRAGEKGGVYRTTNRGQSWAQTSPNGQPQFKFVRSLAYGPRGQALYAGTNQGVWQTEVWPSIADVFSQVLRQS